MGEKFYKVTRSGLTIGNRVYAEGEVVKLDPDNPRLSRSARALAGRLSNGEEHAMLEEVDGRSKEAKENLVASPEPANLGSIAHQTNTAAGKTSDDQRLGEAAESGEAQNEQDGDAAAQKAEAEAKAKSEADAKAKADPKQSSKKDAETADESDEKK